MVSSGTAKTADFCKSTKAATGRVRTFSFGPEGNGATVREVLLRRASPRPLGIDRAAERLMNPARGEPRAKGGTREATLNPQSGTIRAASTSTAATEGAAWSQRSNTGWNAP